LHKYFEKIDYGPTTGRLLHQGEAVPPGCEHIPGTDDLARDNRFSPG
jgi:hypothetical protein